MLAARYLSVGFACALLHNAVMIGGDWLGLHYVASSVASFLIVGVFGYLLHSGWTFSGTQRDVRSFLRYMFMMSANLPLSIVCMFVFVDLAGLPVWIASPLATVLLVLFNFAASRWALRGAQRASR